MSDEQKFENDAERKGYLRGVEETARELQQKPSLTVADVRKMTPEEIRDRMPEVRKALKQGAAGQRSDDDTEAVS